MSTPVRIGNRPISFLDRATIAAEVALADRGFVPDVTFERPASGSGVVAVVVDGEKRLMALGTDRGDALFRLARVAAAPEGRGF